MAKAVRGVFEQPSGSGIWWVNYYVAGRRCREKVGRRSDAIALYQKRKTDARAGIKLPETLRIRKAVLFSDIAKDAMEYSKAYKKSHRGDLANLRSLLPEFGAMKADEITPAHIHTYFLKRTDLAPATLNRYRSTLSMIYQEAMRNGRVKANPARLVRLRKEDNARLRFLTYEEEESIRSIIMERCHLHEPAFTFALDTGLRLSEQHQLTWDRVDLARRQITLLETKNGSRRVTVLSQRALDAIKACEARRNDTTDRVFLSRFGQALDSPVAWFKLVMREAKVKHPALADVTWHVFRHTFISRLVMAGVDLRTVQELAGHKDISMTTRYAHLSPDHKLDAVDRLMAYRERELDKRAFGAS